MRSHSSGWVQIADLKKYSFESYDNFYTMYNTISTDAQWDYGHGLGQFSSQSITFDSPDEYNLGDSMSENMHDKYTTGGHTAENYIYLRVTKDLRVELKIDSSAWCTAWLNMDSKVLISKITFTRIEK